MIDNYYYTANHDFMKKIYLDVCSLCRPFDDQSFMRIQLETHAVNLILAKVKDAIFNLVISPVHQIEIKAINDDLERMELFELIESYGKVIHVNKNLVRKRAEELIELKFGYADAAHVAYAESYDAVFITCDDRLLKMCQNTITLIECYSPIVFCEEENLY